ncbi:MAG TPA: hypothetical protein VGX78_01795 [Pirellulales bacterium]|nr:hypothetical protein [Pirellulales bacterium]
MAAFTVVPSDRTWLLAVCAGIVGVAGLLVGTICGLAYSYVGGQLRHCFAFVAVGFASGALIGQRLLASRPIGEQLLMALAGAVVGAVVLVWRSRRKPAELRASKDLSRYRWAQFSLGSLLVMVALTCAVLALLVSRPVAQRQAMATLHRHGAKIKLEPAIPEWVPRLLGDETREFFDHVTEINLVGRAIGDSELTCLRQFPEVRNLNLERTWITDAGMAHIARLTRLETLNLFGTGITDAGLRNLNNLRDLRELRLSVTKLTDAGLDQLTGLARLESLELAGTAITDEGLEQFRCLAQLRSLDLNSLPITDAGLVHLAKLTQLQSLNLRGTKVLGPGLAHLRGLHRLNELFLDGTSVGDVSLAPLGELQSLDALGLGRTKITDDGVARLAAFVPKISRLDVSGCQITDAGLEHIGKLHNWILNLASTSITDDGLMLLADQHHLWSLDVSKTRVTAEGINRFQQCVQRNRQRAMGLGSDTRMPGVEVVP